MAGPCGEKRGGPDLQSRNWLVMVRLGCSEPRYVGAVSGESTLYTTAATACLWWGCRCMWRAARARMRPSLRPWPVPFKPSLFSFPTALSISGQARSGHPRPRTRHKPSAYYTLPLYQPSRGTTVLRQERPSHRFNTVFFFFLPHISLPFSHFHFSRRKLVWLLVAQYSTRAF